MLRIRLMRMGRRNRPFYRIVVMEARRPRETRYHEAIGYYDPIPEPSVIHLDITRYDYWVQRGAQPTDVVRNLARIVRRRQATMQSSESGTSSQS